jgi:hypothetical protein
MTTDKKKPAATEPKKASAQKEEPLRVGTLLRQEGIPDIEANGFLAGSGLKSTDKMTRSAFLKRIAAWRNQPAGKETR